jgi:3D (Asp-Asp-Asp) domain-containing protein
MVARLGGCEVALHVSGKMLALGLVVFALITAFSAPRELPVPLAIVPVAVLLEEPRLVVDHLRPVLGPSPNPVLTVRATAYNSLETQTNSQPFITATGARTRWGIVAVSRDLLQTSLPYGSLVRLVDLGQFHTGRGAGTYQALLDGTGTFIVEDTMHPRKTNQIDVWFQDYPSAVNWGVRQMRVELVRYGRDGPELHGISASAFEVDPRWLAAR